VAVDMSGYTSPYVAWVLFLIGAAFFFIAIRDWSRKRGWLAIALRDVRIPYVEIREFANARGWKLNDNPAECHNRAQCHNRGYELEKAMRQAASDGRLKVWGRKYETPVGTNPLLLIPKDHFIDFEFGNGYLHSDNVKNIWSHTGQLGRSKNSFSGENYCDLYVSERDIKRLLRRVPPSDGVVTD
jgi:hypothetical protein